MYECPNCSSNLKFNIALQRLACEHCNSDFDPYEFEEAKGVEEDKSYDVTVFTCPQCAGELYTTDNTIAGFCSFCGSTTLLESRVEKELRPDYIIPFRKTKEDCKKAYKKRMRWAIFAPKELKNEKYIESFRGIYMPYWVYDVKQQNPIHVRGSRSYRRGDYIITDYHDLTADLDAGYGGMSYDGSSSFADNISGKIAPFDIRRTENFTPAFLSGFYADLADVPEQVYEEDVRELAGERTAKYIRKQKGFTKYKLEDSDSQLKAKLGTTIEHVDRALFPVWFLAYRNKDRVAYATVNGQTGKVVADLPVDKKKYMLGAILLAIPIFVLLNLFFTVTPSMLLGIVSAVVMVVAILHASEMKEIVERDTYADDKGAMDALSRKERKVREEKMRAERELAAAYGLEYEETIDWVDELEQQKAEKKSKKKKAEQAKNSFKSIPVWAKVLLVYVLANVLGGLLLPLSILLMQFIPANIGVLAIVGIATIGAIIANVKSFSYAKQLEQSEKIVGSVYTLVALGVALVIVLLNPVHDAFYYIGAMVSLAATFFTLLDLIQKYNVLATRRLPQFDYKGGDDRA